MGEWSDKYDAGTGLDAIVGKTCTLVRQDGADRIYFEFSDGAAFEAYHMQDCCEHVAIYDIAGSLGDLIGMEIVSAVEETNNDWDDIDTDKHGWKPESHTWTIQTFATERGAVVVKWLGTSNGYYSESVYFGRTPKEIT